MILHKKDSSRWIWYNNTTLLITGTAILLLLHYKSIFHNQTSLVKHWRTSCPCHTKLPAISVGKRLWNHWCMFFWDVWHQCLGAASVPSPITLTTYQTGHNHSGKLIFPPLDCDYYSLSQHKQELSLRCLSFLKVAWNVWDVVMVKSGARLSSEVRTDFSLIKHYVTQFSACNYCAKPASN